MKSLSGIRSHDTYKEAMKEVYIGPPIEQALDKIIGAQHCLHVDKTEWALLELQAAKERIDQAIRAMEVMTERLTK